MCIKRNWIEFRAQRVVQVVVLVIEISIDINIKHAMKLETRWEMGGGGRNDLNASSLNVIIEVNTDT